MSFTLRGRVESRLAAALPPLLLAFTLGRWWAPELVALMLTLGLLLDVAVYHRLIPYQPGWVALPLGMLELALVYAAMRALAPAAPLPLAVGLYALAWTSAQVCVHALFPRLRLDYAEAGGELVRLGLAPTRSIPSRASHASAIGPQALALHRGVPRPRPTPAASIQEGERG